MPSPGSEKPRRATPGPQAGPSGRWQVEKTLRRAIDPSGRAIDPSVRRRRLPIRPEAHRALGRDAGAGRERTGPRAAHGVASARVDVPASVLICEMGRAGTPVPETRSLQSAFPAQAAPTRPGPSRGKVKPVPPQGSVGRGRTVPFGARVHWSPVRAGLAAPRDPTRGSRAPATTVADGKGAYSRQYGGGSSLGAVTSPTSRGQASGRGGAGGACSRPTPTPPHPTPPRLCRVGADPHLPSRKRGVVGGAQGSELRFLPRPAFLSSATTSLSPTCPPADRVGAWWELGAPVLVGEASPGHGTC